MVGTDETERAPNSTGAGDGVKIEIRPACVARCESGPGLLNAEVKATETHLGYFLIKSEQQASTQLRLEAMGNPVKDRPVLYVTAWR